MPHLPEQYVKTPARILLEVEHRRREITLTRIGEDSDDNLASVFRALGELGRCSNSSA